MIIRYSLVRICIKFIRMLKEEYMAFSTSNCGVVNRIPRCSFVKGKVAHVAWSGFTHGSMRCYYGFVEAGITFICTAFIMATLCTVIPVEAIRCGKGWFTGFAEVSHLIGIKAQYRSASTLLLYYLFFNFFHKKSVFRFFSFYGFMVFCFLFFVFLFFLFLHTIYIYKGNGKRRPGAEKVAICCSV
jgi:hypothetical protein